MEVLNGIEQFCKIYYQGKVIKGLMSILDMIISRPPGSTDMGH